MKYDLPALAQAICTALPEPGWKFIEANTKGIALLKDQKGTIIRLTLSQPAGTNIIAVAGPSVESLDHADPLTHAHAPSFSTSRPAHEIASDLATRLLGPIRHWQAAAARDPGPIRQHAHLTAKGRIYIHKLDAENGFAMGYLHITNKIKSQSGDPFRRMTLPWLMHDQGPIRSISAIGPTQDPKEAILARVSGHLARDRDSDKDTDLHLVITTISLMNNDDS